MPTSPDPTLYAYRISIPNLAPITAYPYPDNICNNGPTTQSVKQNANPSPQDRGIRARQAWAALETHRRRSGHRGWDHPA